MRAVFADPKIGFVFKRIFGSTVHKHLLIDLLNALLELDGKHRIVDLEHLTSEQRVPVEELKLSLVDVKCYELPKYQAGDQPESLIERWAFFFRETKNLELVPPVLAEPPFRDALEVARLAKFTADELELYDRAKIAEQDARGALSLVERLGREAGLAERLRRAVRSLCRAFEIELDADREAALAEMSAAELEALQERLLRDQAWS